MSVLETVQHYRRTQTSRRQRTVIGADLIPRAGSDDPRYAAVDVVARGQDRAVLYLGLARLSVSPADLPEELTATAERIAGELRAAGLDEIGRWATDVMFAYADVPNLAPMVEAAMYLAWLMALEPTNPPDAGVPP